MVVGGDEDGGDRRRLDRRPKALWVTGVHEDIR